MKRLLTDQKRLKVAVRYANAVNCLQLCLGVVELPTDLDEVKIPKGSRKDYRAALGVLHATIAAARKLEMALPTEAVCAQNKACCTALRRQYKIAVEVPDDEFEAGEPVAYKGHEIVVNKLLAAGACCYQPDILKDGEVVRTIFVRSKAPEVSINHFAMRAIDVFEATGEWPVKFGHALPV